MKSIISKNYLLFTSITSLIFMVNIKCSKTDDVVVINNNSNNNDTTTVVIASDTIYITDSLINSNDFVLNEVLYDPPAGISGDANQDGTRDPSDDEFVEFVNTSSSCINISGCKIFDNDSYNSLTHKHQFPNNTFVNPNQVVVVFGGPKDSTFISSSFGNAIVFSASESTLNLNNAGDNMWFTDSLNNVLVNFDISQHPPTGNSVNQSYTRSPDLTGEFVQHGTVSANLFSPGTKADGSSF